MPQQDLRAAGLDPARDATDAAFVARCLGGQPADLVFTDPPSNVSYGAHGGKAADRPARRLCNDALPAEAWERFCRAWAASLTANAAGACTSA